MCKTSKSLSRFVEIKTTTNEKKDKTHTQIKYLLGLEPTAVRFEVQQS